MAKVQWFKGNLHTHTTMSDGDADPEEVTRWYRRSTTSRMLRKSSGIPETDRIMKRR